MDLWLSPFSKLPRGFLAKAIDLLLKILSWESSNLLTHLSPTIPIAHSSIDIFNPTCTDAICAALTWLELGSYPKAIHDNPTLSNIPFYNFDNYDDNDKLVLEPTVTFITASGLV